MRAAVKARRRAARVAVNCADHMIKRAEAKHRILFRR